MDLHPFQKISNNSQDSLKALQAKKKKFNFVFS